MRYGQRPNCRALKFLKPSHRTPVSQSLIEIQRNERCTSISNIQSCLPGRGFLPMLIGVYWTMYSVFRKKIRFQVWLSLLLVVVKYVDGGLKPDPWCRAPVDEVEAGCRHVDEDIGKVFLLMLGPLQWASLSMCLS